jgi:hypothetical protein
MSLYRLHCTSFGGEVRLVELARYLWRSEAVSTLVGNAAKLAISHLASSTYRMQTKDRDQTSFMTPTIYREKKRVSKRSSPADAAALAPRAASGTGKITR